MLRDHPQHNGHELIDVAEAIVDSHLLLLLPPLAPPAARKVHPQQSGGTAFRRPRFRR